MFNVRLRVTNEDAGELTKESIESLHQTTTVGHKSNTDFLVIRKNENSCFDAGMWQLMVHTWSMVPLQLPPMEVLSLLAVLLATRRTYLSSMRTSHLDRVCPHSLPCSLLFTIENSPCLWESLSSVIGEVGE